VLGEYNKNSTNPFRKLDEKMSETAFTKHTYRHTTMGFLKDVEAMPEQYEYSKQFFDRYYRPEYTTIIVVGDAKPKEMRGIVDKYWGEWKRGSYKPDIPAEPPQTEARTGHVDWPAQTLPLITVAFKSPAYDDSSVTLPALSALGELAFSRNSAIYQKLVIQEQKVDMLGGGPSRQVDPGLFEITARVKKAADVEYVRDQILETIKSFQEKAPDAARLEALKKRARYTVALSMDNSDSIAGILARFVALRRTPESMNRFYDMFAKITPEDVQQAAKQYLVESGRTIVTLTGKAPGGGN
jgi:zinc protease